MAVGPQMIHLKLGDALPALKKDVLRLYNMRFCPYAQRTRLVLAHKQIPHEVVNVNLAHKPDWFLARHPLGLVPVLERDATVVYESSVCDDYLDEAYPQHPLYPRDPLLKTRHKMTMALFEKVAGRFGAMKSRNTEGKAKAFQKMMVEMSLLEDMLSDTYFGGSRPMMVDFHIWPWYERIPALEQITGLVFLPSERYPKLNRWMAAMLNNDAVKDSWLPTDLHVKFMMSLAAGSPTYDAGLDLAAKL